MISAWKRFISKNDINHDMSGPDGISDVPPGVRKIDKELQRKFARGINYNMKVVIRGDARVGKTSLFLRLKGYGFDNSYNPTENLSVTSIDWSYKAMDDIVKIDLWEAVDSTVKKSINFVDLKLENKEGVSSSQNEAGKSQNGEQAKSSENNNNNESSFASLTISLSKAITTTNRKLSAHGNQVNPMPISAQQSLAELSENIDVYKNTDAVLLLMDMTKLWTFKYIQVELPKIPKQIPVLVIANFRDQGHHRTVSAEQVRAFMEGLDRTPCDGRVMYTEASMKNGFGLKLIEKFFNIPFLKLQEASFLKQLELNRCEFMSTIEELQLMQESTNREYEQYLELQTIMRRQQADAMSPVNSGLRQLDETKRELIRNNTISSDGMDKRANVESLESNNNSNKQSDAQAMASQNFVNDRLPSIVIGAKCPLPETKSIQISKPQQLKPREQVSNSKTINDNSNIDEVSDDSDDEEIPRSNPLVAGYQSDLDSDDQASNSADT